MMVAWGNWKGVVFLVVSCQIVICEIEIVVENETMTQQQIVRLISCRPSSKLGPRCNRSINENRNHENPDTNWSNIGSSVYVTEAVKYEDDELRKDKY